MTQLPTKRFRGTGLYRNHSRRRGDKEYRIKSVLQAAEREFMRANSGEKESAERAIALYQDVLTLLDTVVSEEHSTMNIVELQNKVRERIMGLQRLNKGGD